MKKIVSMVMLVLTILTMLAFPASAASKRTVSLSTNRSWSDDITCTLNKKNVWGKRKSGTVRVSINNWGVNVDIRMRNGSKVIWSQNNAIQSTKAGSGWVYRDFSLGNNYKYYDLSFRCSKKCWAAPSVTVKNIANCNIT